MPALVILRGNSGSGKTTTAKALQRRFGRNTMVISQDLVRREMLWVHDDAGNPAVALMIALLRYGRRHSDIVILEGILYSETYRPLFEAAVLEFGDRIFAYYYDLPFQETLRRHASKPNRMDFGETEMREWWKERDYLDLIPETKILPEQGQAETVDMIYDAVLHRRQ